MARYPCPCCGNYTFDDEKDAFFEICEVCCWQNDLRDLLRPSSANQGMTLYEARKNYQEHGVADISFRDYVKKHKEYEEEHALVKVKK